MYSIYKYPLLKSSRRCNVTERVFIHMTMIRQTRLVTGLSLWLLVSLSVFVAAAAEPNEAQQVLSQKSHQQQHLQHANKNTYKNNETASLIVEPTSDVEVEVYSLRHTVSTDYTTNSNTELEWPWSGNNNSNNNNKTQDDRTCAGHMNCSSCNDASWCHWCGKDCHARGSIHGCAWGYSCDDDHRDNKKKNETEPNGCGAHMSCSECAVSSHLCHWCAHDNACHSVGSVYGCVAGVDCHSNSICERKEPEPIQQTVFTQIGPLPFLVLITVTALLFCCASTCFCVAGGVKGAYDDLAGITADRATTVYREPLLQQQPRMLQQPRQNRRLIAETPEPVVTTVTTADADSDSEQLVSQDNENANDNAHLVLSEEGNNSSDLVRSAAAEDAEEWADDVPLLVVPHTTRMIRRPRHMQRLYNACTACYIFTVAVIGGLLFGTVHYFPAKPVYNICNDNVAWKSLIDSMASMKVSADFEILASVNNPNYFDVALDMGKSPTQTW